MSRLITIATVSALGFAASGCQTAPRELSPQNNPSLYSMHQPVVERTNYVLDVRTSGDSVAAGELARLDAWFSSIGLSYGDRISIDEPAGYPSVGARRDVAGVAERYGLLLADGAPITNGAVEPGTIRVVASRSSASVPGCPLWSDDSMVSTTATSSNFGCATNSNLAAMIANPDDLVLGQDGSGSGNATTATRAIRVYREGQPTGRQGLQQTTTTGGR